MKVHGLVCFETINGLRAFGSGRLSLAEKHTELLEFRNPKLGGTEYLSVNVPTVFIRKFYYRGILAHLVGTVKKTRDKFGRVGFWGIAAMVDDDKPINVDMVDYLFGLTEFSDTEDKSKKIDLFKDVLSQHDEFPPGELSPYEASDSFVFTAKNGVLTNEILQRAKSLMEIEPSNFSTVIVQLGSVANPNLGELDDSNFSSISERLTADADEIQAELDHANLQVHQRKFIERTDKIGVKRPDLVDAEFENYLIALIRYVNESIAQKRRR